MAQLIVESNIRHVNRIEVLVTIHYTSILINGMPVYIGNYLNLESYFVDDHNIWYIRDK